MTKLTRLVQDTLLRTAWKFANSRKPQTILDFKSDESGPVWCDDTLVIFNHPSNLVPRVHVVLRDYQGTSFDHCIILALVIKTTQNDQTVLVDLFSLSFKFNENDELPRGGVIYFPGEGFEVFDDYDMENFELVLMFSRTLREVCINLKRRIISIREGW